MQLPFIIIPVRVLHSLHLWSLFCLSHFDLLWVVLYLVPWKNLQLRPDRIVFAVFQDSSNQQEQDTNPTWSVVHVTHVSLTLASWCDWGPAHSVLRGTSSAFKLLWNTPGKMFFVNHLWQLKQDVALCLDLAYDFSGIRFWHTILQLRFCDLNSFWSPCMFTSPSYHSNIGTYWASINIASTGQD